MSKKFVAWAGSAFFLRRQTDSDIRLMVAQRKKQLGAVPLPRIDMDAARLEKRTAFDDYHTEAGLTNLG